MDTHVQVLKEVADRLMTEINAIDRIIPYMLDAYPNWDDTDMAEFKTIVTTNLSKIIDKLEEI
jgi:hypothetical protein